MIKATAIINRINTDNISQISITGSPIIFDNVLFIKHVNGIANKNVIPVANSFRSLSRTIHNINYPQKYKGNNRHNRANAEYLIDVYQNT